MELDSLPGPPLLLLLLLLLLLVDDDSAAICLTVEELVESQVSYQGLVESFVRLLRGSLHESFDRRPSFFSRLVSFGCSIGVRAIFGESLDADFDQNLEPLRLG
jgi:hypothetical protein